MSAHDVLARKFFDRTFAELDGYHAGLVSAVVARRES